MQSVVFPCNTGNFSCFALSLAFPGGRHVKGTLERCAAAVDCFTLALDKVYVKADELRSRDEWQQFSSVVTSFVINVLTRVMDDTGAIGDHTDEIRVIIAGIFVRLLDLFKILYTKYGKDGVAALPPALSSPQFAAIVMRLTVDPGCLGVDVEDVHAETHLPAQLAEFLRSTTMKTDSAWTGTLRQAALSVLTEKRYDLVELLRDTTGITNAEPLTTGYQILHEVRGCFARRGL